MGTHPLHDVALRIHNAFASEPRRSWLLERLREWRRDPDARPKWPPRAIDEVDLGGALPSGEPVPDLERAIFTDQEIAFALAAIHDAYLSSLERQTNAKVDPLVERGGELWKQLAPHYGWRWAFERNATSDDWDEGRQKRLSDLIGIAIKKAQPIEGDKEGMGNTELGRLQVIVAPTLTEDVGREKFATKQQKQVGRPKRRYPEIQKDKETFGRWEQRQKGVTLEEFARNEGMDVEECEKLINRCQQERSRKKKQNSCSDKLL